MYEKRLQSRAHCSYRAEYSLYLLFCRGWQVQPENLIPQAVAWARKKMNVVFRAQSKTSGLPRRQGEDVCLLYWIHFASTSLSNNRNKLEDVKTKSYLGVLTMFQEETIFCNHFTFFFLLLSSKGLYLSDKTFSLIPSTFQPTLLLLREINFWNAAYMKYTFFNALDMAQLFFALSRTSKISNWGISQGTAIFLRLINFWTSTPIFSHGDSWLYLIQQSNKVWKL